ncbi:MAG: transcriptional regulator [Bacteroidia bacterium]|nr:transcriptional regulator [Bacteroidia bacterium]
MELSKVNQLIEGSIVHKSDVPPQLEFAFSSDLMSDVLRFHMEKTILITGLSTVQTLRTAEMSNIECIIFARDKKVTNDMIDLAIENNISLITTPLTLFEVSGRLYSNGIKPIF